MAKKNSGSRSEGKFGVDFLTVRLTTEDKKALNDWEVSFDQLLQWVVQIVEAGHKMSFSWSEGNESAICTITSPPPTGRGNKVSVSSFGSSVDNALKSAVYKYDVLAQGGDWNLVEGRQDYGDFG